MTAPSVPPPFGLSWPTGPGLPPPIRLPDIPDLARLPASEGVDPLTGLPSRAMLMAALDGAISDAVWRREPCALLMASVEGLETIHDTFGREAGDAALRGVIQLISQRLRGTDPVGRFTATRIAIVLPACDANGLRTVADRLVTAVRSASLETPQARVSAGLAIGGVELPRHASSAEGAVIAALTALERARRRGNDTIVCFEPRPEEDDMLRHKTALATALIAALQEGRMRLELMPIVNARTRQPSHYEALLRMMRPDGTLVSAGELMPIAEQLGIARLLDLKSQQLTVDLLRRYPDVRFSLNVSGLTASDEEWIVSLHRLTTGRRDLLSRLTVEITETAAINDLELTVAFVETVRALGCKVAIDDFGAGYTNFRNLKQLDPDLVKIDGSFVRNVCHDHGDQVIIRSMVELARAFEMETVAEWVADADIAAFVTEAGIDHLQGFHFGAPAAPEVVLGPPPAK